MEIISQISFSAILVVQYIVYMNLFEYWSVCLQNVYWVGT